MQSVVVFEVVASQSTPA